MRIAMWSGPRNLSTAMMYSFGSRPDCAVWDEPFYAPYLLDTGVDHPLRDETLASWPNEVDQVIAQCLGPIPGQKPVFYQKHMTHHMLPDYDLDWTRRCENLFLIRHPARVIASYLAKRENPTARDIGFVRQVELFDQIGEITGRTPAVFDADDIRRDPKNSLIAMCAEAGIEFHDSMLSWSAGPRKEDGPWAPHWYGAVHKSTGFAGPDGPLPEIPPEFERLLDDSLVEYNKMFTRRSFRQ